MLFFIVRLKIGIIRFLTLINYSSLEQTYIIYSFKYHISTHQPLIILSLWSEMKDFARLSKIGLSTIWKETRKEEISFHGWMLTAFAGLFYA